MEEPATFPAQGDLLLLRSAEKYCVVLNTLRNGGRVESTFSLRQLEV